MSKDADALPEDTLADLLAAYDEGLAAGQADSSTLEETAEASLTPDVKRARTFLWLIERAWPRAAPVAEESAPSDPTAAQSGAHPAASIDAAASRFGRFEILETLGQGGFGIVFLAWDPALRRKVALKVPRPEALVTPEARRRFLREAHAAAGLDHPNIVPVYETGTVGMVLYIATAYCQGPTLATWMDRQTRPVPGDEAARLAATLTTAVQHAHDRGILHRDLKPSNILLQEQTDSDAGHGPPGPGLSGFTPRIADFSLARIADLEGDSTRSGVPLGSPPYMAPEQAEGRLRDIGPATDVYGLGSLLYELLSGQPPFRGQTQLETLRLVVSDEPVPPRRLRPGIARDLECIVLKCLEKSPRRRYATARDLAEDLDRFLAGRPILARPARRIERAGRWVRRHPASLFAVLILALFGAIVLGGRGWYGAQLEASRRLAEQRDGVDRQRERTARQLQYVADIRQAAHLIRTSQSLLADDLLERHRPGAGEDDRRDFAWHHLRRRIHTERRTLRGHEGDVYFVDFSPRGDLLATAGKDGTARIWSTSTWEPVRTIPAARTEVNVAAFSPDGQVLATVDDDGMLKLWSVATGRCVLERAAHRGPSVIARFTADGKTVITGGRKDGFIRLWDRRTSTEVAAFHAEGNDLENAVISPDGTILVTAGGHSEATLWDLPGRKRLRILSGHDTIQAIAFSHDGKRLATADEGGKRVRLFEVPGGRLVREYPAQSEGVFSVAFSPDDRTIFAGGDDATIRLWDAASSAPRGVHRGHHGRVWTLALSPDGRTLASSGRDGTVKLWDLEPRRDHSLLSIPSFDAVEFSPDGRAVIVVEYGPWAISRWDARTGRFLGRIPLDMESAGWRKGSVFSDDRQLVAIWSRQGEFTIWNTATGRRLAVLDRFPKAVRWFEFVPGDRKFVLVFGSDRDDRWFEFVPGDRRPVLVFSNDTEDPVAWLCDPIRDERQVARVGDLFPARPAPWGVLVGSLPGASGRLIVFEPPSTLSRRSPSEPIELPASGKTRLLTPSPDGFTLARVPVQSPREIELRDRRDFTMIGERLAGHRKEIDALSFSPDGRTLGSAGDHIVKLWDISTHEELLTLGEGIGPVGLYGGFSPDGKTLAGITNAPDGTASIVLWHVTEDEGAERARSDE